MTWKRIIIYLAHHFKTKLALRFPVEEQFFAQRQSKAIKSICQAAEWGMDSVSKVWRILLKPLPYNPELRKNI